MAQGQAPCNLCPPGGTQVWQALQKLCQRAETTPPAITTPHRVRIDASACIGCYKCIPVCPVDAIVGAPRHLHQVNLAACTGCDLCLPVCPVDCISRVEANDASIHYHPPHQIYRTRQRAWDAHQHTVRRPVSSSQPALRAPPRTTGNQALVARLTHAIARAKKLGDSHTQERLEQQLQGLSRLQ